MFSVHIGLGDFPAARKEITEALTIMDELGLQERGPGQLIYVSMLFSLADVDRRQRRFEQALATYTKSKALMLKESDSYGNLLSEVAECQRELHQWNEAVASLKECVEQRRTLHGSLHPSYAASLHNLGALFGQLKQYEEAIPRFEEVLAICQRVYGHKHERTVVVGKELKFLQHQAKQSHRERIDVGHLHRMCNQCGKIKENMDVCNGCGRAWYCDTECQLRHWPTHQPLCDVCLYCATVLSKILRCLRCKKAKYCDAECSKAHWSEHKGECVVPTNK